MGRHEEEVEGDDHRRSVLIAVALVAAAAAIVASVFLLMREKGTYAKGIDDLTSDRARLVGKPVRVEGMLVQGSLEKRNDGCEWRFRMRGAAGKELPVRYASCALPDDFRDKPGEPLELTVEGRLQASEWLEATQILTKCPSRYDKEKPEAKARPFVTPVQAF